MNDFLRYWDDVFAYWVEQGAIPQQESYWDSDRLGLLQELMPEPYLGDPTNCSVVIMNYNPGAADYDLKTEEGLKAYSEDTVHHSQLENPDKMCYHYARNYHERMKQGGYVGRDSDPMYNTTNLHPADLSVNPDDPTDMLSSVDESFDFHEGVSRAYDRCDRMGFIDKTGRWVIEPQRWTCGDFHDGVARVLKDGNESYIDHDGKIVRKPKNS